MGNNDDTALSLVVASSSSQIPNNNQETSIESPNWRRIEQKDVNNTPSTAVFKSITSPKIPNMINYVDSANDHYAPTMTFNEPSTSTQPLLSIGDHSLANTDLVAIQSDDSSDIDVTTTSPMLELDDTLIINGIPDIPSIESSPAPEKVYTNSKTSPPKRTTKSEVLKQATILEVLKQTKKSEPSKNHTKQLSSSSLVPVSSSLLSPLSLKRTHRRSVSDEPSIVTKQKTAVTYPPRSDARRRTRSKTMAITAATATSTPTTTTQISRKHLPTGYIYDVYMSYHATIDIFDIHPEDPRRLFYIYREMCKQSLLDQCERVPIKKATHQDILAVHTRDLLRVLKKTKKMTRKELMAMEREYDSIYVNNHSYESSIYAAGGVIELCKAVVADRIKNGFAIVRPPGHHAESNVSMGFCFINNVAIATKYCMDHLGLKKIMIVDWDVHFGNGTYEIFADDPNVVYLSLHRYDEGWFYPADDSGAIENAGEDPALGKCINIAWPTDGTTDADYIYAFHHIVMPIGYEFQPDLVIVSAGFDAADGDDIGMCKVTPAGYGNMTHLLKSLANGRMVMALEGGYNLTATSISATACMSVLMGEAPLPVTDATPSSNAVATVEQVKSVQRKYWSSL